MKNLLIFLIALTIVSNSFADGWRNGEMQIQIPIENQQQFNQLAGMKLSMDFYGPDYDHITAYVIPKELSQIEALGLNYEIVIEDLNKHNTSFWSTKDAYHTYQEIIDLADSLETEFPAICKKYIFGTSLGGRQLAALKISDNVLVDEPEAEVMFDGGIHGDEIGAAENVIRFARDICIDYGSDPTVTNLIDNREIWLYLMVNPDGREAMSRYNNNGVDLNRDWAYMWDGWGNSTGPCSQVESKALRECMYNNQFVVHTTYHSGTEYISLPWSYRSNQPHDWNHIYQLGGVYSSVSGYPNLEYGQGNTGMYAINGSTKDSNYGVMGSISWSMEISYSKQPPASDIMMYYNRNYPSMIAMIEYSGYGLDGTITDINTGDSIAGVVFVNDYFPTYSDVTAGDYHKYVLPGTYSITVVANGYETQTIDNIVVTENNSTVTDFQLQPEEGQYVYRFAASRIPGNNDADEGNTPAVIGAPDNINYSIGVNGWCVLDMQYPVIDGPGSDFKVHEGDTSPEGFTCYAGETIDGPWISLGTGNGTTEFDIATSGLSETQFIKILDDGDGSANVDNAGFDLDAIEAIEPVSGIYLAMTEYLIDDSGGNNNGNIDPGETIDILVSLKNNGDITAENIEGIISTASPYITIISANANFGNLSQGETAQGIYTILVDNTTPIGESFILTLDVSSNSGTYTNSFVMNFAVGLIVEDWETGNFSSYPWTFAGNADWFITDVDPYEGTYCAKSGTISHNQTSEMEVELYVTAADNISFYRKVSSESNYDYLQFWIDGTMQEQWAGEVAWGQVSYPVTAGLHTFKWIYYKDGNTSNGSDCGWIDYIIFPPVSPPPSPPDIEINPESFEVTLPPDDQTTQTLTISNIGETNLEFSITKYYHPDKNSEAYCTSVGGGGDEFIQNVTIGSINNTTPQSYYGDYTSMSTVVVPDMSYPISITNGDPIWSSDECGIWVDWNQNELWDDAPVTVSGSPGVGPYTANIIPPADAMPGPTRMRVQIIYNTSPDPCDETFSYGEVEDYTLIVDSDFNDWLTFIPLTGIIPGSDMTDIDVTFNSTDMEVGDYYADLIISSNDPVEPQVIIPCTLHVGGYNIGGYLNYANAVATPMDACTVMLYDDADILVGSTTTDALGYYEFTGIADGNYTINLATTKPWGGLSMNDVQVTWQYVTGAGVVLTDLEFLASDVTWDTNVLMVDVQLMRQRVSNNPPGTVFIAPDYVYEIPAFSVTGGDVAQDIPILCSGDTDGSYVPQPEK